MNTIKEFNVIGDTEYGKCKDNSLIDKKELKQSAIEDVKEIIEINIKLKNKHKKLIKLYEKENSNTLIKKIMKIEFEIERNFGKFKYIMEKFNLTESDVK